MKILVTGGAGFIGSIAVKKLLAKNHEVVIFDNLSTGFERLINKGAEFVRGDLLNPRDIEAVFADRKIDAAIHFAAFSLVGESVENPQKYFTNNICGSLGLFRAMLASNVKKIVFSSTAAIFGEPEKTPIEESDPKNPTNPYGRSKLAVENILDTYDRAYGLRSVCLRYFNAAGADPEGNFGEMHSPETHLIPLALKAAKGSRESIRIFGTDYATPDGTCIRDYIHVEDLIDAHLMALDYLEKGNGSERFNLGSENGYSVREVITKCKEISGIDFRTEEADRRPGDPTSLVASSQKIRNILGWKATRSLEEIIRDAWQWEQKIDE
ncbi:MAG: UDP-glucose 4-epimerase GalE [Parcubacteria group bacterium]|jgi:UDP-glucose 4-epimerase